jgi:3-(methylsulfanyl)propanoyl-CoA dehydrogenase
LKTARFYVQKILPKTASLFASIMAGSETLMTFKGEEFGPYEFTGYNAELIS